MTDKSNDINIIVDNDTTLKYETNSFLKTMTNHILFFILNFLPNSSKKIIKKSHKSTSEVIEHATTHKAIEVLYNFGYPHLSKKIFEKLMRGIWFNFSNSKAVRNRLRLVERELEKSILEISKEKKSINILSIASGSARAIVEVLNNISVDSKITVSFLDKSPSAIDYSKSLVSTLNIDNGKKYKFRWINDTASNFVNHYDNELIDIVEVVGLFDYFVDEKIISILRLVYKKLGNNGILITANINSNVEQKFITDIIGWKMIYRSAKHLVNLVAKAGFSIEDIKAMYEPLKIHTIIVAKKR